MASNGETFSAAIQGWIAKSKPLMLAILQESSQRMLEKVQTPKAKGGNMPVVTGFLRSSMVVTLNTPQTGFTERVKGKIYDYDPGSYNMVINQAKLGDSIYAVYTANYAAHREYGTVKMTGAFFVRNAAQQWPSIVDGVVKELNA